MQPFAGYRRVALLFCVAALALAQLSCSRAPEAEAANERMVPDFRLASLGGDSLGPSSFSGKVVVFDFWATWCLPCHLQADILKQLHSEFADSGVEFVAISIGEPEDTVREFVDRRPFPYPVLVDPNDEVSVQLGIYGLYIYVEEHGSILLQNTLDPTYGQWDLSDAFAPHISRAGHLATNGLNTETGEARPPSGREIPRFAV